MSERVGLYRTFDGMTWPTPGERLNAIERELRYNAPSAAGAVASIVAAYRELISLPARRREAIIRELRKGGDEAPEPRCNCEGYR